MSHLNSQRKEANLFPKSDHLAVQSSFGTLSYTQLAEHIAQRKQRFIEAGLTKQDTLLLPMAKQANDLINLLAAIDIAGATLLCPQALPARERRRLKPLVSVTLESTHQLKRLQHSTFKPTHGSHEYHDPIIGVLSSGSSGTPKCIWHRLSHFINSAQASNSLLPLQKTGYSLASLPLNHVGGLGLVFRALVNHSALLFDVPADRAISYQRYAIQRASLVPTQLYRLMQQTTDAPTTDILLGGAPISDALISEARAKGWRLHRCYGLSETASHIITETEPDHWQILPHAELKIENKQVYVRGDSLFMGYGHPQQPKQTLMDGWFATGDIAQFKGKHFQFIGRRDNQFTSGAENVCPEAIEQAFIAAKLAEDIIILPKQHPEWGHQTVAMVKLHPHIHLEKLRQFAQTDLLPHQRPQHYYAWQSHECLKIQRAQLIQQVNNNDMENQT